MHRFLARLKVRDIASRAKHLILQGDEKQALPVAEEGHTVTTQYLKIDDLESFLAASYLAAARFHTRDDTGALEILEPVSNLAKKALAAEPQERQVLIDNLAVLMSGLTSRKRRSP